LVALAQNDDEDEWVQYRHQHGKSYSKEEEIFRKALWRKHKAAIAHHNKRHERGEVSYKAGFNRFSDMVINLGFF
jgi:hypothetical protein